MVVLVDVVDESRTASVVAIGSSGVVVVVAASVVTNEHSDGDPRAVVPPPHAQHAVEASMPFAL